jgi:DNA-binding transcriptional regulator YdaS (Cro superfamily)
MAGPGHNRPPPELLRSIDVFAEIRRACAAAGGQKAWAAAHGIAPQHLNDVLMCRREISDRVLRALGLVRVERYARTSIAAPGLPARETQETEKAA